LLRARRERPGCRTTEQSDEVPPSQIEHAASSPGATAIIDRPAACLHRFCAPRQWACTARTATALWQVPARRSAWRRVGALTLDMRVVSAQKKSPGLLKDGTL